MSGAAMRSTAASEEGDTRSVHFWLAPAAVPPGDMISPQSRFFGAIDVIVLARLSCFLTRRLLFVCALASLVFLPSVARGDVDVWSSVGPNGGTVFVLAIDPHAPATIYAGT